MTPTETRIRAENIYYRVKYETESSIAINYIAAQIREAILEQYEGELSPVAVKEYEAYARGFNAASEKAVEIVESWDRVHAHDMMTMQTQIANHIRKMEMK